MADTSFDKFYAELCEYLKEEGNPNRRYELQDTLLHVVAKVFDRYEVIAEVVAAGANLNLVNLLGQTPLHVAVKRRNRQVVKTLISYGASVNSKDYHGNTALHYAIDAYISESNNSYCTIPNYYERASDMYIIRKLLKLERIKVNERNSIGNTPLLWAVKIQNADVVRALLSKGAHVNVGNNINETPLHAAVSQFQPDIYIVSELLFHRACIICSENNGQTPLDLAFTRPLDTKYLEFAHNFLKLLAFKYPIDEMIISSVTLHCPSLLQFYESCSEEINRMRALIIGGKVLFDFIYERASTAEKILDPEFEICKEIINLLMANHYPLYFEAMLNSFKKCELFSILEELTGISDFEEMSCFEIYTKIVAIKGAKNDS